MTKPLLIVSELIDIKPPLISFKEERLSNPVRVTVSSPKKYRRAVFKIAQFFKREFHYDFTQYGHDGNDDDEKHVAFLWIHPAGHDMPDFHIPCVGATCFRWREWTDYPHEWAMQWIWFHPFFRRQGLLTAQWPHFKKEFGEFLCEPPISDAAQNFLNNNGFKQTPTGIHA